MSGGVRSFLGHFTPHAALCVCLCIVLIHIPSFFVVGVLPGLAVPMWSQAVVSMVVGLGLFVAYALLRWYHDRHQCCWCDRTAATDRFRSDGLGLFARHFHWCRTLPGLGFWAGGWVVATGVTLVSSIGSMLTYGGMAVWLASTIAHQARVRSCTKHSVSLMYDPRSRAFSAERVLGQLHYRSRGCTYLWLRCERYACTARTTAVSPEEAVVWTLAHSDEHGADRHANPIVFLGVTVDPQLDPLLASEKITY